MESKRRNEHLAQQKKKQRNKVKVSKGHAFMETPFSQVMLSSQPFTFFSYEFFLLTPLFLPVRLYKKRFCNFKDLIQMN